MALQQDNVALAGDLGSTPLPDLIQLQAALRRNVAIHLTEAPSGETGVIYLEAGHLVDARFGAREGRAAIRRALLVPQGTFRVEANATAPGRTVFDPWTQVVLEELVSAEQEHEQQRKALPPPPVGGPPGDEKPAPSLSVLAAPPSRRVLVLAIAGVAAAGLVVAIVAKKAKSPEAVVEGVVEAAGAASTARARSPVEAAGRAVGSAGSPHGVTREEIVFGMAAPFSGANRELGRSMKAGIEAAFGAINGGGGIHGRKLRLVALDDAYEPSRTLEVMEDLVEKRKVFAVLGNVGTATAAVAAPYAAERKTLFFGALSGGPFLRNNPPDRYVFNYRPSYAAETAAAVRYLVEVRRIRPAEIAVFAQEDAFGDAGFAGAAEALGRYRIAASSIIRVGYKRNGVDVEEAVARLKSARVPPRAVIMVSTYRAACKFIERARNEELDLVFTNLSAVGATELAEELASLGPRYTRDVVVTQVVPLPQSRATAVMRYREALQQHTVGEAPDFVSLEAYVAASILAEGLRRAGPDLDTEGLVEALEGIQGLDLGLGTSIAFAPSSHQGSRKVWGTILDASGQYQHIELD